MADENEKKQSGMSRRKFIRNSSYLAGGAIGGGILGSLFGTNIFNDDQQTAPETTTGGENDYNRALMYFTRQKDFNILSEATERIFPEDDNGPGAITLGVPFFIDHQLAGSYGNNDREYMKGPFYPGSDFQGYQTRLKRHEVFDIGIQAIERESQNDFDASFLDLEGDQQDQILSRFQDDDVEMKGVTPTTFFELLRSATIEGAYADPLYGGNGDMEGWLMKEYPGTYMSYLDEIEEEEFINKEPQALRAHF
ncbi:gluconate 2-dehydrogenase gamma chain [Virgibacillus natechei]|uniref:Gluconate 2-dehydrogenase gamma chain n=1 Tax=Virgibacillus natechei TaxID=1216297 RepID=A0ABS4IGU3_9BACI|nr:gluconate 2-dehydrogenase subunit 3 family protein [Virgibacillus natechei]MBP1970088.1 gluconate 2-dehydrogenase gamma chain [Virgibacillus natechei]UZD14168.1 gluconate 2-dehydrogenase subunit 3 family protein [Virgibacillus natechei]